MPVLEAVDVVLVAQSESTNATEAARGGGSSSSSTTTTATGAVAGQHSAGSPQLAIPSAPTGTHPLISPMMLQQFPLQHRMLASAGFGEVEQRAIKLEFDV